MPKFAITVTKTYHLDIDMNKPEDVEAWEQAIGDNGEIDQDELIKLLEEDNALEQYNYPESVDFEVKELEQADTEAA